MPSLSVGATGDLDPDEVHVEESESDDGLEKYRLAVNDHVARLPTAARRRGDAAFEHWIHETHCSSDRPATDASTQPLNRQSTARLIQSNEDKNIIASPREYQVELFERAKEKNLIIVLDTGD